MAKKTLAARQGAARHSHRSPAWAVLSAPLCAAVLWSSLAAAQPNPMVLEEIVVNAQKRPESLADVPVSVSVMFGDRLTETAISTIEELQYYVPSLVMSETAIGSNLFIRGIGSGVNQGFEQSVGMYVDGVYHGRAQLSRLPFFDLQRVEVLRGPQSALLGKNSVAGALSLVTARPTDSFAARLGALYDPEFDETEIMGSFSGPLGERLRARVAFRGMDSAGYVENPVLARGEPQRDEKGLRFTLGWDFGEAASLALKMETASFDVLGRQAEITADRPALAGPFAGLTYGQILAGVFGQPAAVLDHDLDYRRGSSGDFSNNDADDLALTIEWSLGDLRVTSITGYSAYEYDELCDCDITAANVFAAVFRENFDQVSQEFRLTSDLGRRMEYIAGLYFQQDNLDFFDSLRIDSGSVLVPLVNANPALPRPPFPPLPGTALLANTATPRVFTQDSDVAAIFGHATWNVSDTVRLNFGGRFTDETKSATRTFAIANLDGSSLNPLTRPLTIALYNALFNATPHALAGEREKQKFVPSLRFEWDARDDLLTYLSFAKGFKSGGFDARSNNPPVNTLFPRSVGSFTFDDEEATSAELGAKARLANGRAELYAALYFTDYDALQVSTFDGTLGFNVGNAGAAEVQGLEIEARYRLTDRLTFSGGLGLTDFEYREFFGQCYFGRPPDAPDGINCDYRGRTNEFVADWSGSLSTDWTAPVGDRWVLSWLVDVLFTDDYYLSPTLHPGAVQDGYVKLNSRVAVGSRDGRWEVALLAKNITDETTLRYGNETPLAASTFGAPGLWGFVDPPRRFALQATARFE